MSGIYPGTAWLHKVHRLKCCRHNIASHYIHSLHRHNPSVQLMRSFQLCFLALCLLVQRCVSSCDNGGCVNEATSDEGAYVTWVHVAINEWCTVLFKCAFSHLLSFISSSSLLWCTCAFLRCDMCVCDNFDSTFGGSGTCTTEQDELFDCFIK
jgi:hypothetical protein